MRYCTIVEVCVSGSAMGPINFWAELFLNVPAAVAVVSLALDASVLMAVRRHHRNAADLLRRPGGNSRRNRKKKYTVPVRATLVSAATVLHFALFGVLIYLLEIQRHYAAFLSLFVPSLVIMVVRCPAAITLTFAKKRKLDQENRARGQEWERMVAVEDRRRTRHENSAAGSADDNLRQQESPTTNAATMESSDEFPNLSDLL